MYNTGLIRYSFFLFKPTTPQELFSQYFRGANLSFTYTATPLYIYYIYNVSRMCVRITIDNGIEKINDIISWLRTCVRLIILSFINYFDAEKKINFQMSLCLTSDVSWVSVPKYLELMYMSRNFSIKIDPSGLHPGVHTTTYKQLGHLILMIFSAPFSLQKFLTRKKFYKKGTGVAGKNIYIRWVINKFVFKRAGKFVNN
ncbi:tripeptidyl-peptidase 2 [Aphis craccivora]|uniref:Tripeptidyl-peptidase 2 n=1 Tax=Aphis craccivora TaxID=307492 RepID=A0A6G0YSV2_APHCR|nr:tripeptidyl-peptidase 2 [Aphis craccivora]